MNPAERYSNIQKERLDLWEYLYVLWKRRVIVLSAALLCAFLAGLISFLLPKVYQSELLLRIGNVGNAANLMNPGDVSELSTTLIENESLVVGLIRSESFLSTIFNRDPDKWGRDVDVKELNVRATSEKDVRQGKNTHLVKIQAEGKFPQQAVDIVNAIADEVILRHKEKFENAMSILRNLNEDLNVQIVGSEKQLEDIKMAIGRIEMEPKVDVPAVILLRANLNDRENLLTTLKQKRGDLKLALSGMYSENTKILDPPFLPKRAAKPRKGVMIVFGLFIGIVIGVVLSFGLEFSGLREARLREKPLSR